MPVPFCTTEISLTAGSGGVSHPSANQSPETWLSQRGLVVATNAVVTGIGAFTYDVTRQTNGRHVGNVFYRPTGNISDAQALEIRNLANARAQLTIRVNFNQQGLGDLILNLKP